ncbi:MAG: VOC family protein [Spirochaetales bacterium]|nr:VOC family protein [Spirochaetales bacterium]
MLDTKLIAQVGIIVRDIEASSKRFARFLGTEVPQWVLTGPKSEAQTEYRGKASDARAKLAFFNCGQLDIELIEPDEHPSTWREFLENHGEGIHHIAFVIKGMNDKVLTLQNNGYPLVQKGEYEGGRYAYIDAVDGLHTVIELLENDGDSE